ncbi:MAG: V-type ATP synthase subunit A, partial [Atribacterota bacterium]|nr:V-type ATP synthase subunit A [Atribacterota bacterium]
MRGLGNIVYINGPVVKATNMEGFMVREMVLVGEKKLIGEIISLENKLGTIQVYEETAGLKLTEIIQGTGKTLSLKLGPGILGNIFDGIARPLSQIYASGKSFIPEGIGLTSLDTEKEWPVEIIAKTGTRLISGQVFAQVQETSSILHKIMVPPGIEGNIIEAVEDGFYKITDTLIVLENKGKEYKLNMF